MNTEKKTVTNAPQYSKREEYKVSSYQEATVLADSLFQPFVSENAHISGTRTAEEAKVRIRRTKARDSQRESFRVVLYMRNKPEKAPLKDSNGPSTDDSSTAKQSKAQRKKATKEASRARGKKQRPYGKTKSSEA